MKPQVGPKKHLKTVVAGEKMRFIYGCAHGL